MLDVNGAIKLSDRNRNDKKQIALDKFLIKIKKEIEQEIANGYTYARIKIHDNDLQYNSDINTIKELYEPLGYRVTYKYKKEWYSEYHYEAVRYIVVDWSRDYRVKKETLFERILDMIFN